jgi:hypothetical protein
MRRFFDIQELFNHQKKVTRKATDDPPGLESRPSRPPCVFGNAYVLATGVVI